MRNANEFQLVLQHRWLYLLIYTFLNIHRGQCYCRRRTLRRDLLLQLTWMEPKRLRTSHFRKSWSTVLLFVLELGRYNPLWLLNNQLSNLQTEYWNHKQDWQWLWSLWSRSYIPRSGEDYFLHRKLRYQEQHYRLCYFHMLEHMLIWNLVRFLKSYMPNLEPPSKRQCTHMLLRSM